eukprot:GHVS01085624.1.p1 GENE.GHVS01085624.1~~GHVS01085624.1.p1  ORF type:complete len:603 (-),score=93.90 GHVS01085624.1:694-2502(-)
MEDKNMAVLKLEDCNTVGVLVDTEDSTPASSSPSVSPVLLPASNSVLPKDERSLCGGGFCGCVYRMLRSEGYHFLRVQRIFCIEVRYLLVVVYMFMSFSTGCLYWGWSDGFRELLYREKAYAWMCSPPSTSTTSAACPAQEVAVNNLSTIALVSHMVFSSFSGGLLDTIGPKYTGLVGCAIKAIGWCLLGLSGPNFQAYILAFVFIGGSTDATYLPTLSAACGLLKMKGLAVALLGSAMSTSSAVPVILNAIGTSVDSGGTTGSGVSLLTLCIGYIGVAIGGYVLLSMFILPVSRKFYVQLEEKTLQGVAGEAIKEQEGGGKKGEGQEESAERETEGSVTPEQRVSHYVVVDGEKGNDTHDAESKPPPPPEEEMGGRRMGKDGCWRRLRNWYQAVWVKEGRDFRRFLFDSSFLLIIPFLFISLLRNAFLSKSSLNQLGKAVDTIWGRVRPFSFLACIGFGLVADFFGVFTALFIVNLTGMLCYLLLLGSTIVWKYLTICVFFVFCSYCLSSLFTYIQQTQPARHFGKLSGIANTTAGLLTLLDIPIYDWVQTTLEGDFLPANLIMIGLSVVNFVIWGYLLWRRRKSTRAHNSTCAHKVNMCT